MVTINIGKYLGDVNILTKNYVNLRMISGYNLTSQLKETLNYFIVSPYSSHPILHS